MKFTLARSSFFPLKLMVLLMAGCVGAVEGQDLPPGVENEDLHGPIDQVITEETVEQGSAASSEGQRDRREILRFSDGAVVQRVRVFGEDDVHSYSEFTYDDEGQVVEWTGYDDDDRRLWRYEYEYDAGGRIAQETVFDAFGRVEETTMYQYEGGRLEEEVSYVDSRVEWRKTYTYADSGTFREWSLFDVEGVRFKRVEEQLNDARQVVAEIHFDQFGGVYESVRRRFDDDGRLLRLEIQDGSGELVRLEEHRYSPGGLLSWSRTTLTDSAEPTAEITRYYRDDRGNWTRRVTTVLVGPVGEQRIARRKVAVREITYTDGVVTP
ncbi:MAG: hypothetical protein ACOCU4_00525 [Alkalispirochaeta sp.]